MIITYKEEEGESIVEENNKKKIQWSVFIPAFLVIGGAAIMGLINNTMLSKASHTIFTWALTNFGWLYQIVAITCLVLAAVFAFSKLGKIRFGGKNAKAKHSFGAWFAMTLAGGIGTGSITYGVNEVMIYFGNIYGELDKTGIMAGTEEAGFFGMGRVLYNWTFIPYAIYSLVGVAISYMYFNKKEELSVTSSLIPLFGERVKKGAWRTIVDTLSIIAIALGLASSMGGGLALIGTGLNTVYGIKQGPVVWFGLFGVIMVTFSISALKGIDKGLKWLAKGTTYIFYALLIFLFVAGPTVYILNMMNAGMGHWLDNFWTWGLDPYIVNGEALVTWWTLYDWSSWIAYAPLMGIFFALLAYGRTIRQFMIVNWILPSTFNVVWFSVWSGTGLKWQSEGVVDIVAAIKENGAVSGLWAFLQQVPISVVIIPLVIITLIAAFSTTVNSMSTTIAAVCTKGARADQEAAGWLKILWGVSIGLIAVIMVAFAGGAQGVDGVKYLAGCGGFVVLPVFVLQIISLFKMFFIDKVVEDVEETDAIEEAESTVKVEVLEETVVVE